MDGSRIYTFVFETKEEARAWVREKRAELEAGGCREIS